jgi:hypothetical protein
MTSEFGKIDYDLRNDKEFLNDDEYSILHFQILGEIGNNYQIYTSFTITNYCSIIICNIGYGNIITSPNKKICISHNQCLQSYKNNNISWHKNIIEELKIMMSDCKIRLYQPYFIIKNNEKMQNNIIDLIMNFGQNKLKKINIESNSCQNELIENLPKFFIKIFVISNLNNTKYEQQNKYYEEELNKIKEENKQLKQQNKSYEEELNNIKEENKSYVEEFTKLNNNKKEFQNENKKIEKSNINNMNENIINTMQKKILNEIVYQYGKNDKNNFIINVIDKLKCTEYEIEIFESELKNHSILKSFEILEKVLNDGFDNSNQVIIVVDDCLKYYEIKIIINAIYISDEISFHLNKVEKNITNEQVIERIDYQIEQYKPQVEQMIKKVEENMMGKYIKLSQHLEDNLCDFKKYIEEIKKVKSLENKIKELEQQHSDLKNEFLDYVDSSVIFYETNTAIVNSRKDSFGLIGSPDNNMRIKINDGSKHICNFDTRKMKYLTNLQDITFERCDFKNLEFLNINDKLKKISLISMPNLESISYLTNFPNLEEIRIEKICNIKDLYELEKCPNLKNLYVPNGTNTGCFSKIIKFKINMI